jgi:hypothetical protein
MDPLSSTVVTTAAAEVVKALVAGLTEVAKKIPNLWRGASDRKRKLIDEQVARSIAELQRPGADLPTVRAKQLGLWEGLLWELVGENPDAVTELNALITEIRQDAPGTHIEQPITASGQGSMAVGTMFGNAYVNRPGSDSGNDERAQPRQGMQ